MCTRDTFIFQFFFFAQLFCKYFSSGAPRMSSLIQPIFFFSKKKKKNSGAPSTTTQTNTRVHFYFIFECFFFFCLLSTFLQCIIIRPLQKKKKIMCALLPTQCLRIFFSIRRELLRSVMDPVNLIVKSDDRAQVLICNRMGFTHTQRRVKK